MEVRLSRWAGVVAIIAVLLSTRAVRAQITEADVTRAIEKGTEYLVRRQQDRGTWKGVGEGGPKHVYGVSALCTLALLNAGMPADSETISKSLEYLRTADPEGSIYDSAVMIMAFCAAGLDRDLGQIRRLVSSLEQQQVMEGDGNGAWGYGGSESISGSFDNSNSQFALLALHEAERRGIEVKDQTWRRALNYWEKQQQGDGGWRYNEASGPTGSMTCAGLASLMIASGEISTTDAEVRDGEVLCCGNRRDDSPVEKGIEWLGRNFSVRLNPAPRGGEQGRGSLLWHYYYLYGLERVGRLSGQRFIGEHDWYREGAEQLVAAQDRTGGGWPGRNHTETAEVQTSFALLFLSKGRRPVVAAKLQFGDDNDWNHHRHDLAHLTAHVETRWKQLLTWQTLDIRQASLLELLESPVIYISGRDGLSLTPAQKKLLQDYVRQGGFIFADGCCGGAGFDQQFRALMAELFPDNPLRLLPPDHPVWYAEQSVAPDLVKPLWGVEACCRTSIVYSPEDLSCYWELAGNRQRSGYPAPIQAQIAANLSLGANVLTYATNRQLRGKLEVPELAPIEDRSISVPRGTLSAVKLNHTGGSDDAPAALLRLLRSVQQETQLPIDFTKRLLEPADPQLSEHPVAFIHGRRSFRFSEAQRTGLRQFIENGGFLFGDAICANEQFAESLRAEIKQIFPSGDWRTVPTDHPMFGTTWNGYDIRQLKLRDPQSRRNDEEGVTARERLVPPRLEGLLVDDRYVILFSPWDISCALEDQATLECLGYAPDDAARLGTNILLYGMQN